MLTSMTGFAALSGSDAGYSWHWELRSVNGKGLDLRLRMPDWLAVLEPELRKALSAVAARGNISLGLRIQRDVSEAAAELNSDALDRVLNAIGEIENRAGARGVTLTPASAADVLNARGVMDAPTAQGPSDALLKALRANIAPLCASFAQMRADEGAALLGVLSGQLAEIAALTEKAKTLLGPRAEAMRAQFATALDRVMDMRGDIDDTRLAQEIAILTVKTDVTEEIDRLLAHIAAAETLLEAGAPIGRKLDFLMQEFNREANTLCSKAQDAALTEAGLALKVLIDQMREQVQNVE
ncbi:MAG: YicC/YloC family endoribonuclease [Pseudomonadota bacterium]